MKTAALLVLLAGACSDPDSFPASKVACATVSLHILKGYHAFWDQRDFVLPCMTYRLKDGTERQGPCFFSPETMPRWFQGHFLKECDTEGQEP